MENRTLQLSDAGDLMFDDAGMLCMVDGNASAAQGVRVALNTWKEDFSLLPEHGTDYQSIFQSDVQEVDTEGIVREAIFQEEGIASIEALEVSREEGRGIRVDLSGTLSSGGEISLEVSMDG